MFMALSRDSSTDKEQNSKRRLNNSTLSDKSQKMIVFNQIASNGPQRKILTFCQFPDLLIEFSENRYVVRLHHTVKTPELR